MNLDDDTFHAELTKRFGDFLGDVKVVSRKFHYPLSLQFARRYTDRRLALIGDAAHGMHPVAGQGMNFGLRDVAVLAEKIVDAHRLGLDVGTAAVLDDYQRLRRFDNLLMLGLTDALVRLFSNDIPRYGWRATWAWRSSTRSHPPRSSSCDTPWARSAFCPS